MQTAEADRAPGSGESWDSPWRSAESVTASPHYRDDDQWRVASHDTGNTGENPHADGPATEPTERWHVSGLTIHREWTPLLVDGTVFVATGDECHAFDAATGDRSKPIVAEASAIGSPVIHNGRLFATYAGSVVAYELSSGTRLWHRTLPSPGYSHDLHVTDDLVVASRQEELVALDRASGELRWARTLNAAQFTSGGHLPTLADGLIVPSIGAVVVDHAGDERTTVPHFESTLLGDGLIVGTQLASGELAAIEWETFDIAWRRPYQTGRTSIALGDEWLVTVGDDILGRALETGAKRWRKPASAITDGSRLPLASSLVTDGKRCYVAFITGRLVCLDLTDGSLVWGWTDQPLEMPELAIADEVLVVADRSGHVLALE